MKHLIEEYSKKPDMVKQLLDVDHIKVNLKVDGKPFQILYNEDTDEIEFHGRSGDETHVGPIISDYEKLFSKSLNAGIEYIETKKDIVKKYKFLTFEILDAKSLLLTAVVTLNNEFVNDYEKIKAIADEIGTDVMPTLYEGKLSKEQQDSIINILSTNIIPSGQNMVDWLKSMFGSYKNFPKKFVKKGSSDFLEGIVLFFSVGEKIVEYKIVDPLYTKSMKDHKDDINKNHEEYDKINQQIITKYLEWLEKNIKSTGDSKLVSMQKNFIELMKNAKLHNALINLGAKIPVPGNEFYGLQVDKTIPEIQKDVRKFGDVYKTLLTIFIKIFYKGKKRGFVISQDFQNRINDVTNKF